MSEVETPLQDSRIEFAEETTFGVPPTDPSYSVLTDYLKDFTFSPSPNKEATSVVGESDMKSMFRGAEEPELSAEYYKQQGFVDSSGNPQYPAGHLVAGGNPCAIPSYSSVDVTNNGSTSVDVTLEDEGAATSETVTVAAGATQTSLETYTDLDVIFAESEHDGDITVTDGSGTNVLDENTQLAGSNTDGVEADLGIPPLGTGSHGSAIGTDPTEYRFQGVDTINWQGASLSDRVHALDFTVSVETSREPITGSRGTSIDTGMRMAELDVDTAGPFETATRIAQMYHNEAGDFVYAYPDNDVTINNAELSDAPDYTRSAGDTNYIPSTTWQGKSGDDTESITVTYTGA